MHAPSHSASVATLRLVNADVAVSPRLRRGKALVEQSAVRKPARAAQAESKLALDAQDPRWLLARRTFELLQGGPAAILPPESRDRLNALGARLGLRAFDVSLVIAIVQDHARCGAGDGGGTSQTLLARLSMIPAPAGARVAVDAREGSVLPWVIASVVIAIGMVALAAQWLAN